MSLSRILASLCVLAALSACAVFRLPTVQGNVIEQKQVDQLEIGMTPEQVRYLLGTPLVEGSFEPDRWDYVYYFRSSRRKEYQRHLSLYFEDGRLARIVGQTPPEGSAGGEIPTTAPEDASVDHTPLPDSELATPSEEEDSPLSPP